LRCAPSACPHPAHFRAALSPPTPAAPPLRPPQCDWPPPPAICVSDSCEIVPSCSPGRLSLSASALGFSCLVGRDFSRDLDTENRRASAPIKNAPIRRSAESRCPILRAAPARPRQAHPSSNPVPPWSLQTQSLRGLTSRAPATPPH